MLSPNISARLAAEQRMTGYLATIDPDEPAVLRKMNRQMGNILGDKSVRISEHELLKAMDEADKFLKAQRRDDIHGDSSHLMLEKGAVVTIYPKEARGKVQIQMPASGNDCIVKPTDAQFQKDFERAIEHPWAQVRVSDRLMQRHERLAGYGKVADYEHARMINQDVLDESLKREVVQRPTEITKQMELPLRTQAKTKLWDTQGRKI